jgi:hypothetical protein
VLQRAQDRWRPRATRRSPRRRPQARAIGPSRGRLNYRIKRSPAQWAVVQFCSLQIWTTPPSFRSQSLRRLAWPNIRR